MRQLHIDWNGLLSAFQMNMPEVKCFLSVEDGSVLKVPPGDQQLAEVRAHPEQYLPIEAVPSRIQYQWLDGFIGTVEDDALRARMEAAINGKGAFRRFKDILLTLPDERRRWFEYRDVQIRKRIVEWVAEKGLEPANEPDWSVGEMEKRFQPSNRPQDVEALRDLMISWVEGRDPHEIVSPLALEDLAHSIAEKFIFRPQDEPK